MTIASSLTSSLHALRAESTAIVATSAFDARNTNFVLPQASSFLQKHKVQETDTPTQSQPANDKTQLTQNDGNNSAAAIVNAALHSPLSTNLTPATHAALTDTTQIAASAISNTATPPPAASPFAAAPDEPITTLPNPAPSQSTDQSSSQPPTNATSSAPIQSSAAPVQGNIIQTGAYSSVASSSTSTIRGTGIDILS